MPKIICNAPSDYLGGLDLQKPCGIIYRAGELVRCDFKKAKKCDYHMEERLRRASLE